MVNAKLIVASIASTVMMLPALIEAHSWVDCMDWRFKGSKQSFDDAEGTCAGYARRFPVKYDGNQISPRYAFGTLDSTSPNRHYKQSEKHPDDWPACSTGKAIKGGEGEEVGSDETKASPVDGAYGQGKWGPMTVAKAGQQLCVRWPAKNHKDEPNNIVYINMPPTPMGQDPTQRQLNQWTIAKLDYGNCFSGGSDKARCGGCFTIPENRGPGDYLIQWRWKLNGSDNVPEWYTSCSDVRITNGNGGNAPGRATSSSTPTPTPSGNKGNSKQPTSTNTDGDNNEAPTTTKSRPAKPTQSNDDENDNGNDGKGHRNGGRNRHNSGRGNRQGKNGNDDEDDRRFKRSYNQESVYNLRRNIKLFRR
ncbi:hypothetical protein K493DRAFT_332705 [Basidiobolus meristosporus CBS 931.73]|uniref:Chitin-binding type-4 domain-containing protein n=1 Tax=Basidiobolus meristosporus CBS 931.73 TaxID=1314790 RepID=A0A1Y1ZCD7_9FUNG|nr:hypothetical protein K493DRAFT_332705 [Basidiobolus meristosporus CBS 931.73]|eukprot:ORY07637.1 hypothetical protein K493DRAFT_332705 [Basidiobolus meristosporus CBS 931.73]